MRRVLRDERGQGILEFFVVVPALLLVFGLLIFFGKIWYAKIIAEEAAFDCTRTAIEALDQGQGMWQGQVAARTTIARFLIHNPQNVRVRVTPMQDWERGGWVLCEVSYGVDLSGVPFIAWMARHPVLHVRAHYWGRVQAYKSAW